MNEWAILGLVFVALAVVLYFFIRTKMDPRVQKLANLAYQAAAEIAELPARGSTPPVGLKDGRWEIRGVSVVGNYKWTGFFGIVFWDRILVIKDPVRIWIILIHEMTHAVRRRNGLPSSEAAAYATKVRAVEMAPPEVAALVARL